MIIFLYVGIVADLFCARRPMKEWELDEAMHAMDADGSGQVDYEE